MNLRFGRVVTIHPEDNAVDLVMVDDGSHVPGVQVLGGLASTSTGLTDLAEPAPQAGDKWALTNTGGREMLAACLPAAGGRLWVIGFRFPQIGQMTFKAHGRMVYRHQSDVYVTVDDAGNLEVSHPSGTFLRIGETSGHEDLTGQDVDGKWKIARNTARAPHVSLQVVNGGVQKASVHIDPSGNLSISNAGTTDINTTGAMTISAASLSITTASVAISSGSLTHNGKNVGSSHTHGGITSGAAHTLAPD